MADGTEIAVRTLMSARKAKQFASMRRVLLEQVIYFMGESGHSREDIRADLDEIMALPPGTKPKTKAPLLPLESLAYAEILSVWANHPKYSDISGSPILLPVKAKGVKRVSFERLCKSKYRVLPPSKVLEQLIRYGAVVRTGPNELKMSESYLRLNRDDTESAIYSVMLLADLLHTMTLNRRDKRSLFQRCAVTVNLDPAYLDTLDRLLREGGMDFLEFIDRRMTQHDLRNLPVKASPGGPRKKGLRVTVGLYMSAG